MTIRPRYRRVSALQRQFFNREGLLALYDVVFVTICTMAFASVVDE